MIFDGAFWKNGDLMLEEVWHAREDETEKHVYPYEYSDYVDVKADAQFFSLTEIGSGDDDLTQTQPDAGESTFIYDWHMDEIIGRQPDDTEIAFTHATDSLDGSQRVGA